MDTMVDVEKEYQEVYRERERETMLDGSKYRLCPPQQRRPRSSNHHSQSIIVNQSPRQPAGFSRTGTKTPTCLLKCIFSILDN